MSIQVTNVSKQYGAQWALDGVSFDIPKGQVVGFLGPNGAGKSTMMKIITGYIPATQGEVLVGGMNVTSQSMECRRMIGYLPEHNPLYLDMYVREYLDFVGGIFKLNNRRQKVEEMIKRVGLGVEAHKKIGALSKGYRQRVGLAQAMIHDPAVLILDEPTSGLDPIQLIEIRGLIQELGDDRTVLFSTHIMQEVEAICSRTIIINQGKLITDSDTQALRNTIGGSTIIAEFDRHVSTQTLKNLAFVQHVQVVEGNKVELKGFRGEDIRKALAEWCSSQGITLLTLSMKEGKMEDVFKTLLEK